MDPFSSKPFASKKGTSFGLLMAVVCSSALVAAELHDISQPTNGLKAAQLQLVQAEACPYPPQTPAAAGVEGDQPESDFASEFEPGLEPYSDQPAQPIQPSEPASLVRPAIYVELVISYDDNVSMSI